MEDTNQMFDSRREKIDALLADYPDDIQNAELDVARARAALEDAELRLRVLREEFETLQNWRRRYDPDAQMQDKRSPDEAEQEEPKWPTPPAIEHLLPVHYPSPSEQKRLPRGYTEKIVLNIMGLIDRPVNAMQALREAQKIDSRVKYSSVNAALLAGANAGLYVRDGLNYALRHGEEEPEGQEKQGKQIDFGRKGGSNGHSQATFDEMELQNMKENSSFR